MEARETVTQQEKFRDDVTWIRGYTAALTDQGGPPSQSQLRELKRAIDSLATACKSIKSTLRPKCEHWQKEHPTELPDMANYLSQCVAGFRPLIEMGPKTLAECPELRTFWTDEFQTLLEETLDLYEEALEAIGLELSSDFHKEIDEARREAGIDDDVTKMPAR